MVKLLEIKGEDELTLHGTVIGWNGDNKESLYVNYRLEKGEMVYKFEAYTENNEMVVHKHTTYNSFKRRFPKHRVYIQGYVEL